MVARPAGSRCDTHFVRRALLAGFMTLAASAFAADLKFPPLTGRVVDDSGILSASTVGQLNEMLAQHERTTGEQIVVVTLDSLQGHSIEDYGYQLGRFWGIGQKGKNTGVILIIAPHERKVRIEVGYGMEGRLTDAQSRVIIDSKILPQFRSGDFNAGVLEGTASILHTLGDDAAAAIHPESQGKQATQVSDNNQAIWSPFIFWLFIAIMLLVFLRRSRSPYLMRRGGPFYGGGGFGGGSSDGGGFSGGGGSFGGGGASGSW